MSSWWQTLIKQELAPQHTWREMMGAEFAHVSQLLVPTGETASFVRCPKTEETGCGWDIPPASNGSKVGYCREEECPKTEFSQSDLAMMRLDWAALLSSLAKALGLTGAVGPVDSSPAATQVGWIAPAQTARYPVFFCAPTDFFPLFPQLQRFAESAAGGPFVMILPSREFLDTECLGIMVNRKAELVVLDEELTIDAAGRFHGKNAGERLVAFALAAAGVGAKPKRPKFPTPEGASWSDCRITAIDGHTIQLHARVRTRGGTKEATESYGFADLGFTKRSGKGVKPSADWENFLIPIVQHRRVAAKSPRVWNALKKSKEHVAAALSDLTGLAPEEAFISHQGRRCYEAVFQVECAERDATQVPDAPRRVNQKGQVARGRHDE